MHTNRTWLVADRHQKQRRRVRKDPPHKNPTNNQPGNASHNHLDASRTPGTRSERGTNCRGPDTGLSHAHHIFTRYRGNIAQNDNTSNGSAGTPG